MPTSRTVCLLLALIGLASGQRNLFLHGGALGDNDFDVMRRFVEVAGGVGTAKIGIITLASEAAVENGEWYRQFFLSSGAAEATWIPITMDNVAELAEDTTVVEMVLAQTGIFFGGGDQGRLINGLIRSDGSDSAVLAAIREVFELGGVGGTSAGTACQGDEIAIAGGVSYQAWANPICTADCGSSDDLSYYAKGLGFAYKLITDSHFSNRIREGRLIRLMFEAVDPAYYGVGVDEATALLITNVGNSDEMVEVVGNAGGVLLVDVLNAEYNPEGPSATGIRLTYLTEGDKANLIDGQVMVAEWKSNLAGNELYDEAPESKDIFAESNNTPNGEFRFTATQLFDSRVRSSVSQTKSNHPGFQVTMTKDAASSGWGGSSPTTDNFVISYANLLVDIVPL